GLFQKWQERVRYFEQTEEIDCEGLFEHIEIAQIVVDGNASIVDKNVECADLIGCSLDLGSVGHVQRKRRHAFVSVLKSAARSRIYLVRAASKRLIEKRPADAAIRTRD